MEKNKNIVPRIYVFNREKEKKIQPQNIFSWRNTCIVTKYSFKSVSGFRFITDMCDNIFQEFYSASIESQKTFKILELKGDMSEEAFITEIIDGMISYINKR